MQTRLIILDLDGTLIDSLADLTDAANAMRREFGLPSLTIPEVKTLVGEGARRLVERALPGITGTELERGLELFLRHNYAHIADKTIPYPGVRETLAELQRRGCTLAVASNKSEGHCREILRLLGMDHCFAAILGADSVGERKPSPAPLIHLMQQFGCATYETLMVGDSINDIAAGKSAGIVTIGCSYGYGNPEELERADHIVRSFPELLTHL